MTDFTETLQAKSDQLNATDIIGEPLIIRIRDAQVTKDDQPLHVYFDGDNNRPWKPSKGMRRVLAAAWGAKTDNLIGKYAVLYFEKSVKYAGKEVGGIRIKALSDIQKNGIVVVETKNRTLREPLKIEYFEPPTNAYPADRFEKALPKMIEAMQAGKMTLQQVIAQCQKTGILSTEQLKQLEDNAPIENDNEEDFEL